MSRQQQLLDAAVQVFAERGFEAATVDQVAVTASVSVGTLYNYFASKDEILKSIVLREFSIRRGFLPAQDDVHDSCESVTTLIRRHLHHTLSSPSVSKVILQERRLIQRWQEQGQLPVEGMRTLLEETIMSDTTAQRAEVLAAMLHGAVEGLTIYLMKLPEKDRLGNVEYVMTFLDDFLRQGLK